MDAEEQARRERAALRAATVQVRVTHLGDDTEPWGVFAEEAVSLAAKLSLAAWTLGGEELPRYTREAIPVRVIRG